MLMVGVDIRQGFATYPELVGLIPFSSIRIDACMKTNAGDQTGALRTLFYQLCNFQEAPLTPIFVFDGAGRPAIKRGVRVDHRPLWLIAPLKSLIQSFGYYQYDVRVQICFPLLTSSSLNKYRRLERRRRNLPISISLASST